MKIIFSSIIRNESKKYLQKWLDFNKNKCDLHIILDDCSSDDTTSIVEKNINNGYPGVLFKEPKSLFVNNEQKLRSNLWDYTKNYCKENDWICIVDADEFIYFDKKILKSYILNLRERERVKCFSVNWIDLWKPDLYRSDGFWSPQFFKIFFEYKDDKFYEEENKFLHSNRLPHFTNHFFSIHLPIYLVHYSYLKDEDKKNKYVFYNENVKSNGLALAHAKSILEKKAFLEKLPNFNCNFYNKKILFFINAKKIKKIKKIIDLIFQINFHYPKLENIVIYVNKNLIKFKEIYIDKNVFFINKNKIEKNFINKYDLFIEINCFFIIPMFFFEHIYLQDVKYIFPLFTSSKLNKKIFAHEKEFYFYNKKHRKNYEIRKELKKYCLKITNNNSENKNLFINNTFYLKKIIFFITLNNLIANKKIILIKNRKIITNCPQNKTPLIIWNFYIKHKNFFLLKFLRKIYKIIVK